MKISSLGLCLFNYGLLTRDNCSVLFCSDSIGPLHVNTVPVVPQTTKQLQNYLPSPLEQVYQKISLSCGLLSDALGPSNLHRTIPGIREAVSQCSERYLPVQSLTGAAKEDNVQKKFKKPHSQVASNPGSSCHRIALTCLQDLHGELPQERAVLVAGLASCKLQTALRFLAVGTTDTLGSSNAETIYASGPEDCCASLPSIF